jgi:flagellar motor switch protein FliM
MHHTSENLRKDVSADSINAVRDALGDEAFFLALRAMTDASRTAMLRPIGEVAIPARFMTIEDDETADWRLRVFFGELGKAEDEAFWETLSSANVQTLSNYLKNEYPQTVAAILGKISQRTAAAVLSALPQNFSMEVQMRMLRMVSVSKEVMTDVVRIMRSDFASIEDERTPEENHRSMAAIIDEMDPENAERYLSMLRERNREAAERVRGNNAFVETLSWLEDAGPVLSEIPDSDLALVLRRCSEETRRLILSKIDETRRAAAMKLVEENPRPSSAAIEEARRKVSGVIAKLVEEGRVAVSGASDPWLIPATAEEIALSAPERKKEAEATAAKRRDENASECDLLQRIFDGIIEESDCAKRKIKDKKRKKDSTRVLTSEEIDTLLGFDDDYAQEKPSGIQAILNSALVSYERLPMLEVILDRLTRLSSTSMRNLTADNVETSLDNILSMRFGDYLNSIPLPAMIAVFRAEEWDGHALLTIDSSMIYSMIDVLLGGRRGTAAMRIEGRPYTRIERRLIERVVHVAMSDISAAFDPVSSVTFRLERLETNPRFAAIARPSAGVIVSKLRFDLEDRGGRMELLLPYSTLEPIRELLLQRFPGEKFGRDSVWERHLSGEIAATRTELRAAFPDTEATLAEALGWKVGDTIPIETGPDGPLVLRCGGVEIGVASPAGRNGRYAAVVIDALAESEKTIDNEDGQE